MNGARQRGACLKQYAKYYPPIPETGKAPKNAWRALCKDDLSRIYAQKSAKEIAKEYGLSISGVSNRITRLGIKKSAAKKKA